LIRSEIITVHNKNKGFLQNKLEINFLGLTLFLENIMQDAKGTYTSCSNLQHTQFGIASIETLTG